MYKISIHLLLFFSFLSSFCGEEQRTLTIVYENVQIPAHDPEMGNELTEAIEEEIRDLLNSTNSIDDRTIWTPSANIIEVHAPHDSEEEEND